MADDAVTRVTERLRMGRASRSAKLTQSTPAPPSTAARVAAGPQLGARVFDVQRGQEGTIVPTPPGSVTIGRLLYVQLDSGVINARPAKYLLVRPTPPPARG
jgi:hypothetical protein